MSIYSFKESLLYALTAQEAYDIGLVVREIKITEDLYVRIRNYLTVERGIEEKIIELPRGFKWDGSSSTGRKLTKSFALTDDSFHLLRIPHDQEIENLEESSNFTYLIANHFEDRYQINFDEKKRFQMLKLFYGLFKKYPKDVKNFKIYLKEVDKVRSVLGKDFKLFWEIGNNRRRRFPDIFAYWPSDIAKVIKHIKGNVRWEDYDWRYPILKQYIDKHQRTQRSTYSSGFDGASAKEMASMYSDLGGYMGDGMIVTPDGRFEDRGY